jgi:hypothetical protein
VGPPPNAEKRREKIYLLELVAFFIFIIGNVQDNYQSEELAFQGY